MDQAQSSLSKLHVLMEDSSLYEAANKEKLTDSLKQQAQLESALETLELQWLEIQEEIEAITQAFESTQIG
jgi:ATP-binding cassette subfamily F protein 3